MQLAKHTVLWRTTTCMCELAYMWAFICVFVYARCLFLCVCSVLSSWRFIAFWTVVDEQVYDLVYEVLQRLRLHYVRIRSVSKQYLTNELDTRKLGFIWIIADIFSYSVLTKLFSVLMRFCALWEVCRPPTNLACSVSGYSAWVA